MPQLRAVLVDLSGTLHVGSTPTHDAAAALKRLRAALPVRACSNTSKESRASLSKRLAKMDLDFPEGELFSSLAAAADLCASRKLRPLLILSESAKEDFSDVLKPDEQHPADTVCVGLAPESLDYQHLNEAFRILLKKHTQLIATHRALFMKVEDGQLSLGPGGFISALEQATEKEATVMGKPEKEFFRHTLASLEKDGVKEVDWSRVAIVGDDVNNDLGGGAVQLGLQRYLVRTGKYRDGDEKKAHGLAGVYDDFAAFVDAILT